MKKVAIVGTRGVPANYGGFETLVENIIDYCPSDVKYTIFCSGKDLKSKRDVYKGCELKYIPLHANGMQSIPYDILSLCKCTKFDCILILGTSGCAFLPIFRLFFRKKIIVNIDGLEFRRPKWGKVAKAILRFSTFTALHFADTIISDNKGIKDWVSQKYNKDSVLIAYGGNHVLREISRENQEKHLEKYGIRPGEYSVSVCRIEPENNCHMILEAFSQSNKKLVFIGNWQHSEYSRKLKKQYESNPGIIMLTEIYDLDILFSLRNNAEFYIHGHSAGGTNPSLVEAMFFGKPIMAFDVIYNRETTRNKARYFKNAESLKSLIQRDDLKGDEMKSIAEKEYTWKSISAQYADLY